MDSSITAEPLTNTFNVALLQRALDASPSAIMVTDPAGVIVYTNPTFCAITGFTQAESIGRTPRILKSGKTSDATYREMWTTIRSGRAWHGRILNRRKRGTHQRIHGAEDQATSGLYWASLSIAPILNDAGEVKGYVGSHLDISDRVKAEEQQRFERNEARTRAAIGGVLQSQSPLRERLFETLNLLFRLEELKTQRRAGVFWRPDAREELELLVTCGDFSDEFLRRERHVPFGDCLCGKAAESGELLISDDCFCDPRHERSFAGMTSHGHYIVPLRADSRTLGVMFLYTAPYPTRDESRVDTLRAVGDMMGLAIANELLHRRLVAARDEARSANATKDAFLANMSHEIRTPLTAILGFSESLFGEGLEPSSINDAAKTIHRNGEHLLQLINDLLDLSKIEAGSFAVDRITFDLHELIAESISTFSMRAANHHLSLELERADTVPQMLYTDPMRLRQILVNLIGNAVKFTHTGGIRIVVDTATHDTSRDLVINIIDTGIGLTPEQTKKLFEPFVQGDNSMTRKYGGTGLGLAISKRLATALGGSVSLVKSTPNEGSHFRLVLPIQVVAPTVTVPEVQTGPVYRPAQTTTITPDALAGCRILVAEDSVDNQRLVRMILKSAGAEIHVVENGKLAVEAALAATDICKPFDVILMDMQMPVMDGYEATRLLRDGGYRSPIVALTAHAMVGDRNKCLTIGCDDYLSKPIDRFALVAMIQAHVTRKELEESVTTEHAMGE